jgi:3-hydroxyisobutyrate dehydrogenase
MAQTAADPAERVGFVGLGIMGSRMAANLARAGYELTVFNRTRATAEAWVAEHGGTVADSPAAAGAAADIVISMVVDGEQVRAVLLGEQGVAHGAAPGTLCVDMSTIAPAQTRAIGAELAERGLRMLDAPVTGSSPKAQDGTLTIMAGGDAGDFARAEPLLRVMGELVVHVGALGQGEMVKLINNAVAAANAATVGEALIVGQRTGVDLDALVEVMAKGSGGSAMLDLKAGPMREHDYATLFKLEHMLKDVRLCLEEGQAAAVPFAAAARARDVLVAALARGHGDDDFAALIEALEGFAGARLGSCYS